MTTDQDRTVRERAYHLWVESGHQHGKAQDHWTQAERELSTAPSGSPKAAKAKASTTGATTAAPKASKKPSAPSEAPVPSRARARPTAASPKA